MTSDSINVLCLSRSYLSKLFPTLAEGDEKRRYLHIAQNMEEEKRIRSLGGEVVLNIETLVRNRLGADPPLWKEPVDFRSVTEFDWSPLYTDRYLLNFPEPKRLQIAGIIFEAIQNLFKTYKIHYFLSEPVALFTTHVIFYFCQITGAKCRLWVNTYFADHFFFASTLDYSRPQLRLKKLEGLEPLKHEIKSFCIGVAEDKRGPAYHFAFSQDAKKAKSNYFTQRLGESSLVLTPGWKTKLLQVLRVSRSLFYWISFPKRGDFQAAASYKEHLFYLKSMLTSRSYYDSLPAEASDNFLTYPLQYEPEASLLYAAPDVFDQVNFVEMILRSLPDGKVLYVKEHPNQFGALGTHRWRELRKKYHNVRFIFGRESGRKLIRASYGVIAISSTAGMDAILLGKPVLLAGRVFYDKFPNVTQIKSIRDLPHLIRSMKASQDSPSAIESVTEELINLAKDSYPGDPQPAAALYTDNNIKLLRAAIREECV